MDTSLVAWEWFSEDYSVHVALMAMGKTSYHLVGRRHGELMFRSTALVGLSSAYSCMDTMHGDLPDSCKTSFKRWMYGAAYGAYGNKNNVCIEPPRGLPKRKIRIRPQTK